MDKNNEPNPLAYTMQTAAALVGLSDRYLRTQVRLGYLLAHYAGTKPLILHDDLHNWVKTLPTCSR